MRILRTTVFLIAFLIAAFIACPVSATCRQAPNTLLATINASGFLADIQDDPEDPDGNHIVAHENSFATVYVGFPDPASPDSITDTEFRGRISNPSTTSVVLLYQVLYAEDGQSLTDLSVKLMAGTATDIGGDQFEIATGDWALFAALVPDGTIRDPDDAEAVWELQTIGKANFEAVDWDLCP